MKLTRRQCLSRAAAAAGVGLLPSVRLSAQSARFSSYPFSLGVASGYPTGQTVVLWTRLAPEPLEPSGGMPPFAVPITWELASDERFRRVVASGDSVASPELAHAVHVDVRGLEPSRDYWYRFTAGGIQSAIGRTRTAPAAGTARPVSLGVASCQNYEHGFYGAYAAIARDDLDLIVHVGDYIYENAGLSSIRRHAFPEARTLGDYRVRYALYRSDLDLQRAHAATPWVVIWDDHEVDNDYAANNAIDGADRDEFIVRRAAAYQAFYEHLPLPAWMRPSPGVEPQIYTRLSYGDIVDLYLLDGRQYRSRQACGYRIVEPCPELYLPERTMLGAVQENWLTRSMATGRAGWNLLAQQTVFAGLDQRAGPEVGYWYDGWSNYPAARARLVDFIAESGVRNPVILSGDIHAFLVNDVHRTPGDVQSPVAATEIVTTSISTNGPDPAGLDAWTKENANVRFANGERRGFTRLRATSERLDIELVSVDATRQEATPERLADWHVIDGRAGAVS